MTLLSENDIFGSFLGNDTFKINSVSIAFTRGVRFGSTLLCTIKSRPDGLVEIVIKPKPSIAFCCIFFLSPIVGLIYLTQYVTIHEADLIIWVFSTLILGPVLTLWAVSVANAGIVEKYEQNIDFVLKK